MALNGEAILQAGHRTQKVYKDQTVIDAKAAIQMAIASRPRGDQQAFEGLGQQLLEEVSRRDVIVGADLADNIAYLHRLVGRVCTINLFTAYRGVPVHQWVRHVAVVESGLEACERISRIHGCYLYPHITITSGIDTLPRWYVNADSPTQATYGWQNVGAIRIHEPNDPDLLLD
jgi:hypothetical protein